MSYPTNGFLTYKPYYHRDTRKYYNIICVNSLIDGPLYNLIKPLHIPPISKYKNLSHTHQCSYVIQNDFSIGFPYFTLEHIESLFLFMSQNKYTINHNFYSQHIPLSSNHICMFSYSI